MAKVVWWKALSALSFECGTTSTRAMSLSPLDQRRPAVQRCNLPAVLDMGAMLFVMREENHTVPFCSLY